MLFDEQALVFAIGFSELRPCRENMPVNLDGGRGMSFAYNQD